MSLPLLRLLCCALCIAATGSAAPPAPRFASPLPDPLTATDGTRVQSRDQWAKRRAEIVQLFASEVYYKKYNHREETMPVDQHLLIAAIAPRRVYVASASENATADPAAEFGACVAAEPAFRLFGGSGVGVTTRPAADAPVQQGSIGYHMRAGMHDLKAWDWQHFMTYTDRHWKTP